MLVRDTLLDNTIGYKGAIALGTEIEALTRN
jgi:hypothetical protein